MFLNLFSRRKEESSCLDNKKRYKARAIGQITHFYGKIGVGIIYIRQGTITLGDYLYIKGKTTNLRQRVISLEYQHRPIRMASADIEIGLKVDDRVRESDIVYKLVPLKS